MQSFPCFLHRGHHCCQPEPMNYRQQHQFQFVFPPLQRAWSGHFATMASVWGRGCTGTGRAASTALSCCAARRANPQDPIVSFAATLALNLIRTCLASRLSSFQEQARNRLLLAIQIWLTLSPFLSFFVSFFWMLLLRFGDCMCL